MKAYLLAAGYATRLHPLTRDTAKPLLEIGDRPLLSHILARVIELEGLSEVVVIANHRFVDDFRSWAASAPCPVPLVVLDDGSMSDADKLGALGDLDLALRERPPGDEDFVVIAGDNWLGFDLRAAHRDFEARGRRPMLLLREIEPAPGPSPFNEVRVDEDGRVLHFREKPDDPDSPLVAIAVYFHPARVAELLRSYLEAGENPDAPGYFIEWLVRHAPVQAHVFDGGWMDIGSPEALAEARARLGNRAAAPREQD